MTSKELLKVLNDNSEASMDILLPLGDTVPGHFHVTEVGKVQKTFIDCGGTKRETAACVLQVWVAGDTHHRLKAGKLAKIIKLAEPIIGNDLPVEIEYGSEYLSQYPVLNVEVKDHGLEFKLGVKTTACLAPDKCGVKSLNVCCGTTGCC